MSGTLTPDDPTRMTAADLARLQESALFDAEWYRQCHPDVVRFGLAPLAHFYRIGLALGRDPGPGFCTRFYLADNPDVKQAGLPALIHYLRIGQSEGRRPHPPVHPALHESLQDRAGHLRSLLETGGLTEAPFAALREMAQDAAQPETAARARTTIALWALRDGDASAATRHLAILGPKYMPLHLIARAQKGTADTSLYDRESRNADLHLAATWLAAGPPDALRCINRALALDRLAPFELRDGTGPAFDRLYANAAPAPGSLDADAPLVSVLMAAHNAAPVIGTALRAVTGQSWQALELLVIDDASTDDTAAIVTRTAADDPRIRLIRLTHNRGAYGARNAGLTAARGRYITLHDADDWSHPERLAHHVRFLTDNPGHVGCLSTQVRCSDDLRVSRWTGAGALHFENLTSLMLPRQIFDAVLGVWDDVRVSADSELLRRVRRLFGAGAVPLLTRGPLALQRDGAGTATGDTATGMDWFYHGARREYYESQLHHHARATSLRYTPGGRPFPVPHLLSNAPDRHACQSFDHIYAGVLSVHDASLDTLLDWLQQDRAAERRAALVPLYAMDQPVGGGLAIHPLVRVRIDGDLLSVLCFGEKARCTRFRRLPGQAPPSPLRYLPQIWEDDRLMLAPDVHKR